MIDNDDKNLKKARVSSVKVKSSKNDCFVSFNSLDLLNQIILTFSVINAKVAAMNHYIRVFTSSRFIDSIELFFLKLFRKFDIYMSRFDHRLIH